ncbi:hypothetical protein [Cereibacter sphaeroides]|uniref:hypothetical protein n=1 Tax=Cereibacter sphaeroides TaxID=1063 RepID=UPI001F45FD8B|nr:hypothetical protein [Cereibacter sphaeroides]MCE6968052.1 hypothetical protein [Cereibacter sphaeroides]
MASPRTEFINRVLIPNLPEIVIQPSAETSRDHAISRSLLERTNRGDEVDLGLYTYFTNPLVPVGRADDTYGSPSARVALGQHHVFTFEYDDPVNIPPSVQFGWCRSSGKNAAQSVIGRLHADLSSRYADYFGVTVAWSGNKSLHVHVVFATDLIPALPADANLQEGFKAHWRLLRSVVASHTGHDRPDETCAGPSQFRRLPWGTHRNGNPQVVIWEAYRDRAAKNVSASLFQPDLFLAPPSIARSVRTRKDGGTGSFTAEELDHITLRLREHYAGWPRFERLEADGTGYRALFANSSRDVTPSSYMRENHRFVAVVGTDSDTIHDAPVLPALLGRMMDIWAAELAVATDATCSAATYDEARQMLANFIGDLAAADVPRVLVQAPEGASKTTSVMANHNAFAAGRPSMYAFANYDMAKEKVCKFNEMHKGSGYRAVWIESWSRLYALCAEERRVPVLSSADVAQSRFPNLFEMVRVRQPDVLEVMSGYCQEVLEDIGSNVPVFFAVHDTAHLWQHHSPTRLIWSHAFWENGMNLRNAAALAETKLSLLVHDEASVDTFLSIIPAKLFRFAERIKARARKPDELFNAYLAALMMWRGANRPSFDEVRRIVWRLTDYEKVTVSGRGSYPDLCRQINPHRKDDYLSLYASDSPNAVRDWMIARNDWYRRDDDFVADRIVILTTEELPTACCPNDFEVARLTMPSVPKNAFKLIQHRSLNRQRLKEALNDADERIMRERVTGYRTITNCMEGLTTHMAARGSDGFMGQSILQTQMFAAPYRHEQLCALNDYLGREDCVILDHIDTINQTCGRNLGFRWDGKAEHYLLINRHLWSLIQSSPARVHLRYAVDHSMDVDERRNVQRTAKKRRAATHGHYDGAGYDGSGMGYLLVQDAA